MQRKETPKPHEILDPTLIARTGRIICIDPGTKRVGFAVCDELQTVARPIERVLRTSWKKLLIAIASIISEYDAVAVIVGLPLESDGTENPMTKEARSIAQKLAMSTAVPVFYHQEHVTSYEAKGRLWSSGMSVDEARGRVDSEAAAIILTDFLESLAIARRSTD